MISEDLDIYLIEINNNPDLSTSCPLLNRLIPAVIENTLKITVDPYFPPTIIT